MPLITRQGYEKLKTELDHLWRVERPEVTKMVTWARAFSATAYCRLVT
jgi:transcription elongation factor GreB